MTVRQRNTSCATRYRLAPGAFPFLNLDNYPGSVNMNSCGEVLGDLVAFCAALSSDDQAGLLSHLAVVSPVKAGYHECQ